MKSQSNLSAQDAEKTLPHIDLLAQLQLSEKNREDLQRELISIKERFSLVLQATRDAVWDWDLIKNTGWYSESLNTLFGYDPKHTSDGVQFWYDTIHPDDKERVVNGIHAVIDNGGKNWHDRYRFKKADGTYAWVFDRGYAIHNSEGKPIRMVGSMQDITTEVETREALRESEERFRGAFDNAPVGISIASIKGEFLLVNNAYPKIFGYTQEELVHKTISDLSHPDEVENDRKIINDLISGSSQIGAREKRYIHKSGKVIWGRVFGTVIYDLNNTPKYLVGVLEDITEQREVMQVLQENEERLRLVIDSARIGTWDFNPQTGKIFWDDRCKAMFGMLPDDDINYQLFLDRVHPDDREIADETNRNAINGVGDGEYDLEYRTVGLHDQKIRWVRAKGRSYRDETGTTVRYAGTVIDITEEKKHEQLSREQEERFRLLATSIPQIVWTTNEHGTVDYISDKWKAYTGHTPTYERSSFEELMQPDDKLRVLAEWDESIRTQTIYSGEYRLWNKSMNEYRWFSCTIAPLKDANGKGIKWVGSATDIHDQKMAEMELEKKVTERTKELRNLNQKLEKSNAELEQYAYVTSHDLKEPLRKIQTYNSLITTRHKGQLTSEVLEFLSKIESASLRMSGLIEDLLKYSSLSNHVAVFDAVDLNHVVRNVSLEFEHSLKQKSITFESSKLPVLNAVGFQMYQLFFNLFSNAIKFSKPDSINKITISASLLPEEEKSKHPSLQTASPYYKVTFKDEGIGFASKYSEQIFTVFQRLNHRTEFEGHGIGLALCRKIVNNHRGLIWANSEEGKGAEFTMIFPVTLEN